VEIDLKSVVVGFAYKLFCGYGVFVKVGNLVCD
jgi:hypothetical protein